MTNLDLKENSYNLLPNKNYIKCIECSVSIDLCIVEGHCVIVTMPTFMLICFGLSLQHLPPEEAPQRRKGRTMYNYFDKTCHQVTD
jgi:hypothetical protein